MTTLQPAHPFASSFLSGPASPGQFEPAIPSQPQPLSPPQAEKPAPSAAIVQDGLYRGSTRDVQIELRVDYNGAGVISGDLWRLGADKPNYVASFRTAPGERVTWAATWVVFGQDEYDRRSEGRLSLAPDAAQPTTLIGRIEFASPLEGLPVRRSVPFIVERVSGAFRQIGLEIEIEEGVTPPGRHTIDGRATTIESALQSAGIEVSTSGLSDRIPRLGKR